jgi:hypothetical protein
MAIAPHYFTSVWRLSLWLLTWVSVTTVPEDFFRNPNDVMFFLYNYGLSPSCKVGIRCSFMVILNRYSLPTATKALISFSEDHSVCLLYFLAITA